MGDNTEYYELDFDIDTILDTSETIEEVVEEVVETPEKKFRVNFQHQHNFKSKKKSFVWSYFQEENGNDVCKILISVNGKETTCGKSYKHDGSTGNMKQHLQMKHGILESEELHTGLEKYAQPKIDNIFKKVIPHSSSKQKELKKITAEWLITDSLPFNVVNKKGYLKMMKTIDPAFNPPSTQRNNVTAAPVQLHGSQNLIELEIEENNKSENVDMEFKVLRTINEVKTRWNSSFLSWQRLLKLRTAIEWLSSTLHLLEDAGAKEDSRKLNNYKLNENEWELLEGLVMLFKPFDELTTYFSGIKYTTLSVVNPSIETLKFEFADGDLLDSHELNKIFNDNETENLGFDEDEISSDDESSGDDSRNIKQLKAPSSQQIISKVKGIIYSSLWNYWSDSEKIGLMATLLDPRLKLMEVWSNETREEAIKELRTEFNTWQIKVANDDSLEEIPSSSTPSFMKKVFCHSQRKVNHEIEIDNYLNEMITPTQPERIDVYQWWNNNRNSFPILSRIARKYLSIPTTSIPWIKIQDYLDYPIQSKIKLGIQQTSRTSINHY
ncbi:1412_t:CDS:2, partial [Entrophospora sp. SA101]